MSELKQTRLVTPVGRLAFSQNLYKTNKKGRYTVAVVFDKADAEIIAGLRPLQQLEADLIKDKWGDKKPSGLKTPMKVEVRPDMLEKYDFMTDMVTLNASNGFEVPVIDSKGMPVSESDIKAGDYVKLSISGYAYDNELKGIGFNVNGVQLVKEGEAFYGRQSATDMFGLPPVSLDSLPVAEENNTSEAGTDFTFGNF